MCVSRLVCLHDLLSENRRKNWDKLSTITGGTLSSRDCFFPLKAPATISKICHSSSAIISDDVQTGVLHFKHRTTRMMTTLVSSSAPWPYLTVYLCVLFISVRPAAPLFSQAPRWLREAVSGLIQLTSAHCPPLHCDKRQKQRCAYTTSVGAFVLSALQRTRHVRIFLRAVYTVQCFSAQIMFPTHKVYISPLGGSGKLQLCYLLHTASAKHWPGPDCRNRCTKFRTSLQTIDHINVRLSYKCRGEVNVTPHGGVKCILRYISNSWH